MSIIRINPEYQAKGSYVRAPQQNGMTGAYLAVSGMDRPYLRWEEGSDWRQLIVFENLLRLEQSVEGAYSVIWELPKPDHSAHSAAKTLSLSAASNMDAATKGAEVAVGAAGTYLCHASWTFPTSSGAKNMQIGLGVDGAMQNSTRQRVVGAAGNWQCLSTAAPLVLAAGAKVCALGSCSVAQTSCVTNVSAVRLF